MEERSHLIDMYVLIYLFFPSEIRIDMTDQQNVRDAADAAQQPDVVPRHSWATDSVGDWHWDSDEWRRGRGIYARTGESEPALTRPTDQATQPRLAHAIRHALCTVKECVAGGMGGTRRLAQVRARREG